MSCLHLFIYLFMYVFVCLFIIFFSSGNPGEKILVWFDLVGWLFPEFTDAHSLYSTRYVAQRSSNAEQIITSELCESLQLLTLTPP